MALAHAALHMRQQCVRQLLCTESCMGSVGLHGTSCQCRVPVLGRWPSSLHAADWLCAPSGAPRQVHSQPCGSLACAVQVQTFDARAAALTRCAASALPGDGGNIEKLYVNFVDEPGRCPAKEKRPSITKCPTKQDGHFCPSEQPLWSAFRCAQEVGLMLTAIHSPGMGMHALRCHGSM